MATRVEDRYQSAADFERALSAWLHAAAPDAATDEVAALAQTKAWSRLLRDEGGHAMVGVLEAWEWPSRKGLPAVRAGGYDDLSAETLAGFEAAHVGVVEAGALRAALAACVVALLRAGTEARLPHAETVAQRLVELG